MLNQHFPKVCVRAGLYVRERLTERVYGTAVSSTHGAKSNVTA